jgi:hypothetical protein
MNRWFPKRAAKARFIGRKAVAPFLAALLLLGAARPAFGLSEDDLPSGRLGYKWVPTPPRYPMSQPERLATDAAKIGAAALAGLWLWRKLFASE